MDKPAIVGVGFTTFSRHSGRHASALAAEACLKALADAGMSVREVDGITASTYGQLGTSGMDIVQSLGIPDVRWHVDPGGLHPAAIGTLLLAADGVQAKSCQVALMYKVITRATVQTQSPRSQTRVAERAPGANQFRVPYDNGAAAANLAMWARRHMHVYGTKNEHFGWVGINGRRHAARNERACFREPITMEDYFNSRMIADPFRLLDCDPAVDGAIAFVIASPQRARDCPRRPVWLAGWSFGVGPRPDWENWPDMPNQASSYVGKPMWERAGVGPKDVDVAEIYDGFSFLTIKWLEDLGFCAPGEGGPFLEGGTRTDLDGELPLNTHGGNLSEGRVHGAGFILEAVQQLRSEAGPRQVKDAKVSVVTNGGGPTAGGAVLATE